MFTVDSTSPRRASFTFSPVSLNAELSSSSPSYLNDVMTFTNSLYPTCISKAKKRSTFTITNADKTTTTITNATSASSSHSTSTSDSTTIVPPASQLTEEQMVALRDSYIGEYESTGCDASPSCCCASGITTITANSSASNLVNIDTTLTGSGFSCLQQDGPVHMSFTLTNSTSAEAAPFVASNVKFYASVDSSNADEHKILVSNTVHPACPTMLVKKKPVQAAAATTQSSAILAVALILATIGIIRQ